MNDERWVYRHPSQTLAQLIQYNQYKSDQCVCVFYKKSTRRHKTEDLSLTDFKEISSRKSLVGGTLSNQSFSDTLVSTISLLNRITMLKFSRSETWRKHSTNVELSWQITQSVTFRLLNLNQKSCNLLAVKLANLV